MSNIDKISAWLKETVHGGSKAETSKKHHSHSRSKPQHGQREKTPALPFHKSVMRVIPIGGLEEVGKNSMLVEYENDLIMIDAGFQFAEQDMFGVDYVIPDIQYAVERKNRIKGIVITHGHLDHIGGLPWILPDLDFPTIYSYKLTIGLIQRILEEHKMLKKVKLVEIDNKRQLRLGAFEIDTFRVNHSIPDAYGLRVKSPEGTIIHTGDFKFDFTPADGVPADIDRIARFGREGIDILFADSTGSTKAGHTPSERVIGEALEKAVKNANGRLVLTCFSSLIGRIQQIMNFALHSNRKVFLSGRSIEKNIEMARDLGFIKIPDGLIKSMKEIDKFKDDQVMVLTTGSQGEPMAALSRMATESHPHIKIKKGDTIVLSASPIIGNERSVAMLVDSLSRLGAKIIHNGIMDIHTSGHGYQEDLKMMLSLVKPKHFVPVHGNHYMRRAHGDLGIQMKVPEANIHMMDNGNVIEIRKGDVSFKNEDIKTKYIVVDGLGRGDLESQVLKDREAMAENGIIHVILKLKAGNLIGSPLVTSAGFVYAEEQEKMLDEIKKRSKEAFAKVKQKKSNPEFRDFQHFIRGELRGFISGELNRRPLIEITIINV